MTIDLFKNINGVGVNLIKLDMKYLDDMWEYSSDPKMYEHFEFNKFKNIDEQRDYLKKLIKRSNAIDAYWWFIQIKDYQKIVGSFGIHDIDFNRKSCEISYAISPNFWGKGVFIEALKLVLKRLINEYNFYRVTATTFSNNIRSIESLKKLGFKKEGEFRGFYKKLNGNRFDATALALIASEFVEI